MEVSWLMDYSSLSLTHHLNNLNSVSYIAFGESLQNVKYILMFSKPCLFNNTSGKVTFYISIWPQHTVKGYNGKKPRGGHEI